MKRILKIASLCAFLIPVGLMSAHGDDEIPDFRDTLGFDPNPAYPNGRPNPDAPEELSQFAFFIGEFDCTDRQKAPDGEWREFPAIWNASYFLNGFGIQDKYYAPGFQTSNIRIFDPDAGVWKVTFFSAPGYNSGVWSGEKTADDIVLEQVTVGQGETSVISRLTFYDITNDGFEWRAESIVGEAPPAKSWTSSCRRRKH